MRINLYFVCNRMYKVAIIKLYFQPSKSMNSHLSILFNLTNYSTLLHNINTYHPLRNSVRTKISAIHEKIHNATWSGAQHGKSQKYQPSTTKFIYKVKLNTITVRRISNKLTEKQWNNILRNMITDSIITNRNRNRNSNLKINNERTR